MKHIGWLMAMLMLAGCSSDARLVQLSEQAAERQAAQNHQMARVTSEVAAASKELIEADAQARQEMAQLHNKLGEEHRQIGRQRDQLEQERQQIAEQRQRDPLLAAAITTTGLTLAGLLPLLLAGLVIWRLRDAGQELETLNQLLVEELVAEQPRLLPAPDAANQQRRCLAAAHSQHVQDDDHLSEEEPPF